MKRRPIFRRMKCSEPSCEKYANWEFANRREYMEHVRTVNTYTCCRHAKGEGVLSPERLKTEWTSEPSRPLDNNPSDPYRSFGHSGVMIGPGYYAEGRDFPTGTRIKITAEVILPDTPNPPQRLRRDGRQGFGAKPNGGQIDE